MKRKPKKSSNNNKNNSESNGSWVENDNEYIRLCYVAVWHMKLIWNVSVCVYHMHIHILCSRVITNEQKQKRKIERNERKIKQPQICHSVWLQFGVNWVWRGACSAFCISQRIWYINLNNTMLLPLPLPLLCFGYEITVSNLASLENYPIQRYEHLLTK